MLTPSDDTLPFKKVVETHADNALADIAIVTRLNQVAALELNVRVHEDRLLPENVEAHTNVQHRSQIRCKSCPYANG